MSTGIILQSTWVTINCVAMCAALFRSSSRTADLIKRELLDISHTHQQIHWCSFMFRSTSLRRSLWQSDPTPDLSNTFLSLNVSICSRSLCNKAWRRHRWRPVDGSEMEAHVTKSPTVVPQWATVAQPWAGSSFNQRIGGSMPGSNSPCQCILGQGTQSLIAPVAVLRCVNVR